MTAPRRPPSVLRHREQIAEILHRRDLSNSLRALLRRFLDHRPYDAEGIAEVWNASRSPIARTEGILRYALARQGFVS